MSLPSSSSAGTASITVLASPASWIESDAAEQCRQVAALDGMLHVAGMPDLHPGKGAPIGAAMLSNRLYPHLVGSDIGCGIAVFPISLRRVVPERLARRFPNLDREPTDDDPAWDALDRDALGDDLAGFGTLGRGNHFVELARVDTVLDAAGAALRGIAGDDVVLIVHSGSRGLGERILRGHVDAHRFGPAPDAVAYLSAHDHAVRWAALNRRMLAVRTADALGARLATPSADPLVDVCHNGVDTVHGPYLHHKGAAPGGGCDVLVAGSRGTRSYLVAAHAGADANFSVAHGAGRKLSRGDALRRGQAKHTVQELRRTPLGSLVVCGTGSCCSRRPPARTSGSSRSSKTWPRTPWRPRSRRRCHWSPTRRRNAGPTDDRPGAPPADRRTRTRECAWAVTELAHRLHTDAEQHHLTVQQINAVPGDDPGTYRSLLLALTGPQVDAFTATWSGTLCWQAPSPYRPATARKNWFVAARALDPAPRDDPFTDDDVDIVACRTGGPGGQHRNKASTAVRATHRPTGLTVVVDTERQFSANRRIALQRLRHRTEQAHVATQREAATDLWATHDHLIRGNPTRVERPRRPAQPR